MTAIDTTLCQHCRTVIAENGRNWIHLSGNYSCPGAKTFAEPADTLPEGDDLEQIKDRAYNDGYAEALSEARDAIDAL